MLIPIYTFRFSYKLQDSLLQLIAEFGKGNYYFVLNASILNIIFNYAIANLKVIYAYNAIITLSYPNFLDLIKLKLYIGKVAFKKVISKRKGAYIKYFINLKIIRFK